MPCRRCRRGTPSKITVHLIIGVWRILSSPKINDIVSEHISESNFRSIKRSVAGIDNRRGRASARGLPDDPGIQGTGIRAFVNFCNDSAFQVFENRVRVREGAIDDDSASGASAGGGDLRPTRER